MSNSLLEAMASGLPCLASAIGGNTDLIDDHQTGRLVPPNDRPAWTQSLVEALNEPNQAREMGDAARRRIESEFALPVVVDRYLGIYRDMLA